MYKWAFMFISWGFEMSGSCFPVLKSRVRPNQTLQHKAAPPVHFNGISAFRWEKVMPGGGGEIRLRSWSRINLLRNTTWRHAAWLIWSVPSNSSIVRLRYPWNRALPRWSSWNEPWYTPCSILAWLISCTHLLRLCLTQSLLRKKKTNYAFGSAPFLPTQESYLNMVIQNCRRCFPLVF